MIPCQRKGLQTFAIHLFDDFQRQKGEPAVCISTTKVTAAMCGSGLSDLVLCCDLVASHNVKDFRSVCHFASCRLSSALLLSTRSVVVCCVHVQKKSCKLQSCKLVV